jgi:ribonuclease HII
MKPGRRTGRDDLSLDLFARAAAPARTCGSDEAGRGPLAGPVVAAAVILDARRPIEGLRDSKQLTALQRDRLAVTIQARASAWAVAVASVEEIDRLNILNASLLAMQRAIEALEPEAEFALIDGNQLPRLAIPASAIVNGDATEPAIAAASILAKTHRDALMRALDEKYPGYGFARHAGYATAEHLEQLRRLGPCAAHRRSFAPVRLLLDEPLL